MSAYLDAPARPVLIASSVVNQRTIGSSLFVAGALCLLNTNPATLYSWDPASAAADDGAAVVRPNDIAAMDPGRWLRIQVFGAAAGVVGHKQDEDSSYLSVAGGSYTAHGAYDDNPVTAGQNVLVHSTGYTTKSATSVLKIAGFVAYAGSAGTPYMACLHSPSVLGGDAMVVACGAPSVSSLPVSLGTFSRSIASPGAGVAMTINLRFGQIASNGSFYVNGWVNSALWSGGSRTWIEVTEYDFG